MLQSKFSKKQNVFCAQKIFTDRTKPTEVFEESVLANNNDSCNGVYQRGMEWKDVSLSGFCY